MPELVVLHNISLPPGKFGGPHIDALFTNQLLADDHPYFAQICALTVSSHFMINRKGRITQYVGCDKRAWHAGKSSWKGRANCNDYAIGIELEGTDTQAFTDQQYQALSELIPALWHAYPSLPQAAITGHEHIAPGRKTDPGPAFDWQRLKRLVANDQKAIYYPSV